MNNVDFSRNLVKGKIVETVFAQMLRDTGKFTVLEFGYEKIIPELVQYGHTHDNETIETLRTAPDFAIINKETRQVHLIEVKYRREIHKRDILNCAKKMHVSWNPSFLFIATQEEFYFDEITEIIKNDGAISPLVHKFIPKELQENYIRIIKDFESNN